MVVIGSVDSVEPFVGEPDGTISVGLGVAVVG